MSCVAHGAAHVIGDREAVQGAWGPAALLACEQNIELSHAMLADACSPITAIHLKPTLPTASLAVN